MKYLAALFLLTYSVLAVDVPSISSRTLIDANSLLPSSAPIGVYNVGSYSNDGVSEFQLTGPANYNVMSVASANGATASIALGDSNTTFLLYSGGGVGIPDVLTISFSDTSFTAGSNRPVIATQTISVNIINSIPTISVSASPLLATTGAQVALFATTADPDNQPLLVSYDYGDGSSGINATHAYAAPGTYTVTATVDDGFGGKTTAQTTITVVGTDHLPVARFTQSDIVAFVGIPFVLDGITSTDEQNAIVSYSWNFGDDTPLGSVATLSHIYKGVGLVTVTLTVTDAEGFSSMVSREVEVLSEQAAATFDSEVRVSSTFYPQKQNRDILTVFARVNVGDTTLGAGSAVALGYAGKRFVATLDKKGKGSGFIVKQNLRRQTPGTVEITFKARNTALTEALTVAGAIDGGTVDIPFRLELGPKTVHVDVPTDFELSAARGKGAGELE